MVALPSPRDILIARQRIGDAASRTPMPTSMSLAQPAGAGEVRLKLELLQSLGSFKVRGAHSKVAAVAATRPGARLITASTGNHALAVAQAANRFRLPVTILVGAFISPAKLAALRALESDSCVVEVFGRDSDDTEAEARRREALGAAVYVPPYNDPEVIAGQGGVAVEILEDWPQVDTVVVPVGGGGLISGIGVWVKAVDPAIRVVGVQPSASAPLHAYLATGRARRVPIGPTLADGVAGNVERGSITFRLLRRVVDEVLTVEEDDIASAMRWAMGVPKLRLEGSGALGIAALRGGRLGDLHDRRVAVVVTGGNVDDATFDEVMAGVG